MKIKDLISYLETFDKNSDVYIYNTYWLGLHELAPKIEKIYTNKNGQDGLVEENYTEEDMFNIRNAIIFID